MRNVRLFILALALSGGAGASAQAPGFQWAYRVQGYSSQAGYNAYSAKQVLGAPDKWPASGDAGTAWAPGDRAGQDEIYIKVGFREPQPARQVVVAETNQAGSVARIYLYDRNRREHLVYEAPEDEALADPTRGRLLTVPLDETRYDVYSAKVVLKRREGWNRDQIDAIGISGGIDPWQPEIRVTERFTYPGRVTPLDGTVNSPYTEVMPRLSPEGDRLYFCRKNHPENYGMHANDDIWFAERDADGRWAGAQNIGWPLNDENHNYVCSVGEDELLTLGNGYRFDRKPLAGVSQSFPSNGKYVDPLNLQVEGLSILNLNAEYYLSRDRKVLILAMESWDSEGGKDLYVSFSDDLLSYSKPVSMGPALNSAGHEMAPFLSDDGNFLFYSSDGFPGYGGQDVFVAERLDETWEHWSEPENLGPQVNSPAWDAYFYYHAGTDRAYLASNRDHPANEDLYEIRMEPQRPDRKPVTRETDHPLAGVGYSLADLPEARALAREGAGNGLSAEGQGPGHAAGHADAVAPAGRSAEEAWTEGMPADGGAPGGLTGTGSVIPGAASGRDGMPADGAGSASGEYVPPATADAAGRGRTATAAGAPRGTAAGPAGASRGAGTGADPAGASGAMPGATDGRPVSGPVAGANASRGSAAVPGDGGNPAAHPGAAEPALARQAGRLRAEAGAFDWEGLPANALPQTDQDALLRHLARADAELAEALRAAGWPEATAPGGTDPALAGPPAGATPSARHLQDATGAEGSAAEAAAGAERTPAGSGADAGTPPAEGLSPTGDTGVHTDPVDDRPAEGTADRNAEGAPRGARGDQARRNADPRRGTLERALGTGAVDRRDEAAPAGTDATEAASRRAAIHAQAPTALDGPRPDGASTGTEEASGTDEAGFDQADRGTASGTPDRTASERLSAGARREGGGPGTGAADGRPGGADAFARTGGQAPGFALYGRAYDAVTGAPLAAELALHGALTGRVDVRTDTLQPFYAVDAQPGAEIEAVVRAEGYFTERVRFRAGRAEGTGRFRRDFPLIPIREGQTISLDNIYFDVNSSVLQPESFQSLDRWAEVLANHPGVVVQVQGHTNNRCSPRFCQQLSQKRAKAVSDYLAERGVDPSSLRFRGFGSELPVADNRSASGRARNQRVELKILKTH